MRNPARERRILRAGCQPEAEEADGDQADSDRREVSEMHMNRPVSAFPGWRMLLVGSGTATALGSGLSGMSGAGPGHE